MYIRIREDGERFGAAPLEIYGDRYAPITPLKWQWDRFQDPERTPCLRRNAVRFFLAERGREVVGRIAAYVGDGARSACFDQLDCVDEPEIARMLLDAAETFALEHGCASLIGPIGIGSGVSPMGAIVARLRGAPRSMQTQGPEYLVALIEACGYARWYPCDTMVCEIGSSRGSAPRDPPCDDRLRVRSMEIAALGSELDRISDIYNDAIATESCLLPMNGDDFRADLSLVEPWIASAHGLICEDGGAAVGAALIVPDLAPALRVARGDDARFRRHLDRHPPTDAVLVLCGVRPEYQRRGVLCAILRHGAAVWPSMGIERVATTWIANQNRGMRRTLACLRTSGVAVRVEQRLTLLRKDLSP